VKRLCFDRPSMHYERAALLSGVWRGGMEGQNQKRR
jgi:hypothetical protein